MISNPGTVQADKVVLRQKFRDLRRKFKSSGGRAASQQLLTNLQKFRRDFAAPGTQFCLYRARRDEAHVDLRPLTDFFYPVLNGEHLEFRRPHAASAFQANKVAIEEPILEQSAPLDPKLPMIVFCPAVAIDQNGMRLGLGKGYYDRFFARYPEAVRVGVVFQVQFSSQPLPVDSWDQAMDWVITEKMILRVNGRLAPQ